MVPKFQSQHDTWKSSSSPYFFLWWQRSERKEIRRKEDEEEEEEEIHRKRRYCVVDVARERTDCCDEKERYAALHLFFYFFFFFHHPGLIFHLHLSFHSTQQTLQGLFMVLFLCLFSSPFVQSAVYCFPFLHLCSFVYYLKGINKWIRDFERTLFVFFTLITLE